MSKSVILDQIKKDSVELATIYKTKNYDMFDFLTGNRSLDNSNLHKIKASIKNRNVETNAIICAIDEKSDRPLKIIDGQHRFTACKEQNIPISFVIDESIKMVKNKEVLEIIVAMNTASKDWDVNGFMISHSAQGNKNYELYQQLFVQYSLEHESFFFILNNSPRRIGKNIINYTRFKNGDLIFDKHDYNYLSDRLIKISKFINLKISTPDGKYNDVMTIAGKRYFIKSLNMLYNTVGFNDEHLISKILSVSQFLEKCTSVDKSLEMIRKIYNHAQRTHKLYIASSGNKIDKLFIE